MCLGGIVVPALAIAPASHAILEDAADRFGRDARATHRLGKLDPALKLRVDLRRILRKRFLQF